MNSSVRISPTLAGLRLVMTRFELTGSCAYRGTLRKLRLCCPSLSMRSGRNLHETGMACLSESARPNSQRAARGPRQKVPDETLSSVISMSTPATRA
jgi:hypothetical protein